ncbi:MAG: SBBP repeat-containing protein [Cyanobacteria bacterium J06627_28]
MEDNSFFNVALLTPASDLVGGFANAQFEGIFARAGNDTIYAFDPAIDYPDTNIDFLFGDLFDNSAEEFAVIVGITEGDPFAILEPGTNIPSVGRDRFVLGDERQAFYTASNPLDLFGDNPLGTNEFAVIYDFDAEDDIIQLHGKKDDYNLIELDNLQVDGVNRPVSGEAIFYNRGGAQDLIGFIVSTPEQDYKVDDKDVFDFVGDKVEDGEEDEIVQVGTFGNDSGQNTAIDQAGNIYVVGSTSGSLGGPNQGDSDVWIEKYNNNGNRLWRRQLGSSEGETAYEVVADDEGFIYVAGNTGGNLVGAKKSAEQDAWVAKFRGDNGNIVWGQQFNPGVLAGDTANPAFASTAFGLQVQGDRVYVSGLAIKENQNRQIFDFSAQDDSWVGTFDRNSGAQGWFTQIRDPQAPFPLNITPFFDENYDLAVDEAGNSYLVGWTQGLSKESDPSRLLLKYDAYLAKVDPAGNVEWVQQFGSVDEGLEFGWAVDTDSQGNIYASGWTTGDLGNRTNPDSASYDVWLTKFTPDGTQQVTKQIGSKGDDGIYFGDLTIDNRDNIYLTGYSGDKLGDGDKGKGDANAFAAKFNTQLEEEWIRQLGVKEKADYATGIAVDNNGSVIVTGFTEGSLGGKDPSNGGIDSWTARLDEEKGDLEKFVGKQKGFVAPVSGGVISVTDISDSFVTDDQLPGGDNDVSSGLGFVDIDSVADSLQPYFDPDREGSFTDALRESVQNGAGGEVEDIKFKGTDGDDTAVGGAGDDELKGEKGNDTLFGMAGEDKIEGKDGNDMLYGGADNDEVKGGKGNDTLYGIDIDDALLGSGEVDELKGEDGADRFILGSASGIFYQGQGNADYALIEDFEIDEGDRIQLRGGAGDYTLQTNVSGLEKGAAIFSQGDLVGIVKDLKDASLTDANIFEYV